VQPTTSDAVELGVESLALSKDHTRALQVPFSRKLVLALQMHQVRFQRVLDALGDAPSRAKVQAEFDVFRETMARLNPVTTAEWLASVQDLYVHDFMQITGIGIELPPAMRSQALLSLLEASKPKWLQCDPRHAIVDLHLLFWRSEDEIIAQLGLMATVAQLHPGTIEAVGTVGMVSMACRTVLRLQAHLPQPQSGDVHRAGATTPKRWLVDARRVYTEASFLLNTVRDDDDDSGEAIAQTAIDALKIILDFVELVELPNQLPRDRARQLAAALDVALADNTEGELLASPKVRDTIWDVTDVECKDTTTEKLAEHFRTAVLRRMCSNANVLRSVIEEDDWLISRLFVATPIPGTAVVLATLMRDDLLLIDDDDGVEDEAAVDGSEFEWGALAELILEGRITSAALGVVDKGLQLLERESRGSELGGDSQIAAMACDVIQHHIGLQIGELGGVGTPAADIAELVHGAKAGLKDTKAPLRVAASAAFLKAIAVEVGRSMDASDALPAEVVPVLNDLFGDEHPLALSAMVHLLKQLRRVSHRSIQDIAALCAGQEQLPRLAELRLCHEEQETLPCDPLAADEAVGALSDALVTDAADPTVGAVNEFAAELKVSQDRRAAVLSILLHRHTISSAAEITTRHDQADRDRLSELVVEGCCGKLALRMWRALPDDSAKLAARLVLTTPGDADGRLGIMILSVQTRLIAVLLAQDDHVSVLHTCFTDPAAARDNFFPLAPDSKIAEVARALREAGELNVAQYSCKCGNRFFVGNCGQVNQVGRCPACKARVGGEAYTPLPGTVREATGADAAPVPGYPAAFCEQPDALPAPERDLLATSTRMLDVLLHLCLAASTALDGRADALVGLLGSASPDDAVAVCHRRIIASWNALKDVAGGDDDVFALLHDAINRLPAFLANAPPQLETPQLRREWEAAFQTEVAAPGQQGTVNAAARIADFQQRAQRLAKRLTPWHARIDEVDPGGAPAQVRPRLFRFVPPKHRSLVEAALERGGASAQEHAFLQYALESGQDLALVAHLVPLVRWSSVVVQRCSHHYSREKARSTTIAEFLTDQRDRLELEVLFDEFAEAWRCVIESKKVTHLMEINNNHAAQGCTPLEGLLAAHPQVTKQSLVAICCAEPAGDGALLWSLILYLAQLQNSAMIRVAELAADGVWALRDFRFSHTGSAARVSMRAISQVQPGDLLTVEWDDDWLDFVSFNPEHGRGRDVVVDLFGIEEHLAFAAVHGRRALAIDSVNVVVFDKEQFHEVGSLFNDLHKAVEQVALPRDSRVLQDPAVEKHAAELHEALQVIVWSVARTGATAGTRISEYVEQRIPNQLSRRAQMALNVTSVEMAQLRHLQALFEVVEDNLTDVALEDLPSGFCVELPPELLDAVLKRIGSDGGQIPLAAFSTCLRQFAFRYLRVPSTGVQPGHLLTAHIDDERRWPRGEVPPDLDLLRPVALEVRHTYYLIRALEGRANAERARMAEINVAAGVATSVPRGVLQRRRPDAGAGNRKKKKKKGLR